MTELNKHALKPGNYAILFRNNWDGEGDTYETLAILDDELVWRDEDGKELLEYEGDAVLKAWAMDDGSNLLAQVDELEVAEKRITELEAREVVLPKPHAHLIWIQAGYAPDDYWDDVVVSRSEQDKCCDGSDRYPVYALWEIEEALRAAGISIKGE